MDEQLTNEERERYIRFCQAGHAAAIQKHTYDAHFYFRQAVEIYPFGLNVWLWLSRVVENREDRQIALENVLSINSSNEEARRRLRDLLMGGDGI